MQWDAVGMQAVGMAMGRQWACSGQVDGRQRACSGRQLVEARRFAWLCMSVRSPNRRSYVHSHSSWVLAGCGSGETAWQTCVELSAHACWSVMSLCVAATSFTCAQPPITACRAHPNTCSCWLSVMLCVWICLSALRARTGVTSSLSASRRSRLVVLAPPTCQLWHAFPNSLLQQCLVSCAKPAIALLRFATFAAPRVGSLSFGAVRVGTSTTPCKRSDVGCFNTRRALRSGAGVTLGADSARTSSPGPRMNSETRTQGFSSADEVRKQDLICMSVVAYFGSRGLSDEQIKNEGFLTMYHHY